MNIEGFNRDKAHGHSHMPWNKETPRNERFKLRHQAYYQIGCCFFLVYCFNTRMSKSSGSVAIAALYTAARVDIVPSQVVLYTQMYRHSPSPPSSPSSCDTDCLLVCLSYPSNKLTILSFFLFFFRTRNLSVYAKSNIPLVRNGTLRSNPQIVQ